MDLIIALLTYLGIIAPGTIPTAEQIGSVAGKIEHYQNDLDFQEYYNRTAKGGGVVVLDIDCIE